MALIAMAACLVLATFALYLRWQVGVLKRARDDFRLSHDTLNQCPRAVMWLDADTLHIIAVNAAFTRQFGLSWSSLSGKAAPTLFEDSPSTDGVSNPWRDPPEFQPLKVRHRTKDGQITDVELLGHRVVLGRRQILSYACHDSSLRERLETSLLEKQQHLDHLAHHDPLTGLPNRLFLAAHLPEALIESSRSGQILAVLFLDLDRFKHINDSRGHEAGDQLLKAVAQRIRATVRSEDITIRMGGDEFVVIMKTVRDADDVNEATVRIQQALSSPILVNGTAIITTASIGVSLYPRDGADMGELLRHSDSAMYQAKERGRNNCQVFSPLMDKRLKQRIAIETHLRLALETQQLTVYYQPIIEILTNQVVALEALLRWNHPVHGRIAPSRFIGIAEESGLIVPIGEFVLERTLSDAKRWRAAGCAKVPIAVNVSAAQLLRSNLAGVISSLCNRLEIEANVLQIELTESTIFERRESRNGESNEDAVTRLRNLGIHISIDDFGTGYSSLSYLKRWPVDSIKIDKSFVRDLGSDPGDMAIVNAIVAMAKQFRIPVIAEGIESWQQLELLRKLGCARAQGHLISKPVAVEHCYRFLHGLPVDLTDRGRHSDPKVAATGVWPQLAHQ